jgi:hypothetical protein
MWVATASIAHAQNCVISGGTNYGSITQNCTIVGPTKLAFQQAIADELVSKLPPGKTVLVEAIGSPNDQAVGRQYAGFIQSRGFKVELALTGSQSPPPDHPITIQSGPDRTFVTIFPAAR